MHLKTSFAAISRPDTRILVLGSMPGDRSLELGEYYGHERNRFWKMLATITNNPVPLNYTEKKELLFKTRIGLWDVAHTATRKGSLDSAMRGEVPNDLEGFIAKHPHLEVIAFNGKKAEALYTRYFTRKEGIIYLPLPSTSPANAGVGFERLCEEWGEMVRL